MRLVIAILIAVASLASGCSEGSKDRTQALTKHQRDSTLAESKLPGAGVVKKSLALSDSAQKRADKLEHLPR